MTDRPGFSPNLKWLFTEQPPERRPAAAAAAGFQAVEIPQPYELEPDVWRHILHDAGVQQILINTPVGPTGSPTEFGAACVPGAADEFRAGVRQALQYATKTDCSLINVMVGVQLPTVDTNQATDTYLENLDWASAECSGVDVTLLIEAVNPTDRPGAFIQRQEHAAELIEQSGSGRIGLLFDFYHCQMAQGNLARNFQQHSQLIKHVQIADAPSRAEPGTGEINYRYILEFIRNSNYDGWIGCEYTPTGKSENSFRWVPAETDHDLAHFR